MHFYDYIDSPRSEIDDDHSFQMNFNIALRRELMTQGGYWDEWHGAAGGLNYVARLLSRDGQSCILKVPQNDPKAQQLARAERAIVGFINDIDLPCPVEIPRLLRYCDDPYYSVFSDVPGDVIQNGKDLSPKERYNLGQTVARIALWEAKIDTAQFTARVIEPHGNLWNWPAFFDRLEDFNYDKFPALEKVSADIRTLRRRFYPTDQSMRTGEQFIQSDFRPPNLAFKDSGMGKVLSGAFDWGVAQLGNRAHEARGIYNVGQECISGYNDELTANQQFPVDVDEVRFWSIGRYVGGLVWLLDNRIPNADNYLTARTNIKNAYPELDWSEFDAVDKKIVFIQRESGPGLGQAVFV